MNSYFSKPAITFFAFLILTVPFFLMESGSASAAEKGAPYADSNPMGSIYDANKRQIDFVQSEIDRIRQDLDWLSSRIKTMEVSKRYVPDRMYESMEFKQNKIKILTKLKEQLGSISKKDTKKKSTAPKKITSPKKSVGGACGEKAIEGRIKQFGLADWLELIKDKGGSRIENRLPVLFASGSAEIAEEYKAFLKNVAMVVKGCKVKIIVDGHADTDPIRTAEFPSNAELESARASSVVQILTKNGINPSAFEIGKTGQYRFAEHKASKWKTLNRHVNLTILLLR